VKKWKIQYALVWRDSDGEQCSIHAPAEFHYHPEERKITHGITFIEDDNTFLDRNDFRCEVKDLHHNLEFYNIFKRGLEMKYPGEKGSKVCVLTRRIGYWNDN